jgi:hypothetical protein
LDSGERLTEIAAQPWSSKMVLFRTAFHAVFLLHSDPVRRTGFIDHQCV